jgi:predicted nucleic acid-binding protein
MIKAKSHKAKSDKETIIDMEPVNDTQKTIILKNPIFLIPLITIFLFIIILNWLTLYYLPNYIEQQSNKIIQLNNKIEALKDKENIKINKINTEIKLLKNKLNTLDFNTSETINLEIKNQGNSLLFIKEELDRISNKIKILENKTETANKEIVKKNKAAQVKRSYEPRKFSQNIEKPQKELIKEGKIIIEKLLSKKDFGSSSNYDEVLSEETYLNRLKNYFAGFLKLRKFSDNTTPRGLITIAEKELENKNFNNFLSIIKTLPENWKETIKDSINRFKRALNQS